MKILGLILLLILLISIQRLILIPELNPFLESILIPLPGQFAITRSIPIPEPDSDSSADRLIGTGINSGIGSGVNSGIDSGIVSGIVFGIDSGIEIDSNIEIEIDSSIGIGSRNDSEHGIGIE